MDTMPVLNVEDVRELERRVAADGTSLATLMRRAGGAVAHAIRELRPDTCKVCILAGAGNNGGDGWVVAEALVGAGYAVVLASPVAADEIKAQPAAGAAAQAKAQAKGAKGTLQVLVAPTKEELEAALAGASVAVDALLGTGFSGDALREPYAQWVECLNAAKQGREELLVVSVDVPSGMDAQTGACASPCVKADLTITMMTMKPGLVAEGAIDVCELVDVARICDLVPYRDFIESVRVR